MTISRLAPQHRGRILVPVLGKVTSTGCTDLVHVRLVSGQSPADFTNRADNLAHGFGAFICRVRTARPGRSCWNWSAGPGRRAHSGASNISAGGPALRSAA